MNAFGLRRWGAALMVVVALGAASAQASLTIDFDTLDADGWTYWFTSETSALDAADVAAIVTPPPPPSPPLTLLYKANVGKVDDPATIEEGLAKYIGSYTTEFFDQPLDPADATISYDGPTAFVESPLYLVIKDGSAGQYLIDITDWDRTCDLSVIDFFPGAGAISHVAVFGGEGVIPEPTMLLVWSGLAGMALQVRRRRV